MSATTVNKISAMTVASNTDLTSYPTGSNSPVATSAYLVVCAALRAAGQTATPTLAGTNGWNVTWTNRGTVLVNDDLRLTLFSGTTGASTTAGTLTADYGAETQEAHGIVTVLLGAANAAPVQVKTGTTTAGTTLALTMDGAFADAWNATLYILANDATTGGPNNPTDTTMMTVGGQTAATDGVRVNMWFTPNNLSTYTNPAVTSSDLAGMLVELDHDGSDVGAAGVGPGRGLVQTGGDIL